MTYGPFGDRCLSTAPFKMSLERIFLVKFGLMLTSFISKKCFLLFIAQRLDSPVNVVTFWCLAVRAFSVGKRCSFSFVSSVIGLLKSSSTKISFSTQLYSVVSLWWTRFTFYESKSLLRADYQIIYSIPSIKRCKNRTDEADCWRSTKCNPDVKFFPSILV